MPGGTPATHFSGPVLHTGGTAAARSLGATYSQWPGCPIGFEDSSFYWWRNFNFGCGLDVPGATATITGSVSTTNMVSNLNPWTQTNVGSTTFNIDCATLNNGNMASMQYITGATSGNSGVSSLGLTGGNTGLTIAAKRLYFSIHLAFTQTATTQFFVGWTDLGGAPFSGNTTDGWGFVKQSAATTIVPFSVSNSATAIANWVQVPGSTGTTITGAAHTINLHLQGLYVVGESLSFWADTAITAEGGPTVLGKPTFVGYTNASASLPKASDQSTFSFGACTLSNATK